MSGLTSPFKFLDSYQQSDFDVFFGREKATVALYDALSGVKHLIVYGPSGAGKSSLVECGLRNQFSDVDWYALTIRKGDNINASVFSAINTALIAKIQLDDLTKMPREPQVEFGQAVEQLFAERYQPVYLLFDQFEELLISGEEAEKATFFMLLNKLIRNKLPCRILLIMREEFIGHLSEFEPLCPSIFQHRFRVEKMGRKNVVEVIYQILEAPRYRAFFTVNDSQRLAENIIAQLPDKKKEIELAHVQVFLGELWDRAQEAIVSEHQLPVIGASLVKETDNLEAVLDSFLKKQLKELETNYGERVPLELLAAMITDRFTKLQLSEAALVADLAQKNVISKKPVPDLLKDLEQRRIIRTLRIGDETQYEISHDLLALLVGQSLTEEMKLRERARDVYQVYEERQGYFSMDDLNYLLPYRQYLSYPTALEHRIRESEIKLKEDENSTLLRQQKQLRRTRTFAVVISLVGIVAILVASYAAKLKRDMQIVYLQTIKLPAQRFLSEAYYPNDSHNYGYFKKNLVHEGGVTSAVFSSDGKKILTASADGTATIWDAQIGKKIADLSHDGPVYSAVFSPDGKKIVTASYDGTPTIWDAQTGKKIADLTGHEAEVNSAVFSPDGKKIVTASDDKTARIWDAQTRKKIADLTGHEAGVNSAVFSPDGKKILTASDDGTAKIWDAQTGKKIADLTGHEAGVRSAVFSPDGKMILTASYDKTAKIWDAQTGKKIADLTGHAAEVNSAVFSPNGKRILTASGDKTAKIWLSPEGIMDWLKTANIYKLTEKDYENLGIDFIKVEQ